MPRINPDAHEENNENLAAKIQDHLANVSITTCPVLICGVNRRVGLAHYEHIDLYAGIALPMTNVSTENMDELKEAIVKVAELGFNMVSKETYERYNLLVQAQKQEAAAN